MPTGLYVLDHLGPAERGEVIVLEGIPSWGRPYLMKRVVGVEGDFFCWDSDRQQHRLNDRWMPGPSDLSREMGIPVWAGCRAIRRGEYVGFGSGSSYDSRHLGPVSATFVVGVYRLLVPSGPPARQ